MLEVRLGDEARPALALLAQELDLDVLPFRAAHARTAHTAFRRFGKGRHPAALSFGDCLTYATAKENGRPLLFVGDDFSKTDLLTSL